MKKVVTKFRSFVLYVLLGKKKPVKKKEIRLRWKSATDEDVLKGLNHFSNIANQLQGHPHYTVPQCSMVELQSLIDEFHTAKYEYEINKSGISLHRLHAVREKMRSLLQFFRHSMQELNLMK